MDEFAYLFSLEQFGIKFGLENIRRLLDRIGNPDRTFRSVHVAGTNGKGSVTAMVDTALREAGHRSARYTSPHLMDVSERFVIDGRPVTSAALRAAAADLRSAIQDLRAEGVLEGEPTFFEATTALAFDLFRRAGVEVAVIEVGLGGRLDSTNVITPVVCAITSIDFDHEKYLGSTLGEIAYEKAGIIKPGVPVVVGDVVSEALGPIERAARERGADLIRASEGSSIRVKAPNDFLLRTPVCDYGEIHLALPGAHQIANALVAVRILETLDKGGVSIPAAAIVRALETVSWPGRMEHRTMPDGRELILDAAHNPAGATALAAYLDGLDGPKPTLVFAAMKDKDVHRMLASLLPVVARVVVTRATNARSADPEALAAEVRSVDASMPLTLAPSASAALVAAALDSRRIVVAGSIFLLGDVMREIAA